MKIVFILNGIYKSRCLKRVEEFIENGYDVDVYGFSWDNNIPNVSDKFHIEIIGYQSVEYSYFKRLRLIMNSLKSVYKKYEKEDVLFYYFFIDVALGAFLLHRKRSYIYEESDIPYCGLSNTVVRNILKWSDRRIIEKSFATIMTSEGFIDYHFGGIKRNNIILIPNRLNPNITNYTYHPRNTVINNLSIGFVGGVRYRSIVNFAKVFAQNYPNHSFHFFGNIEPHYLEECRELDDKYKNIHFYGVFKNPQDLPSIYEQIDLVLATYDYSSVNVRYAEPNKMYEAIYFKTPIIVSSNTFLSKKVEKLGIGYSINAMDDNEIIKFVENLTLADVVEKKHNCEQLPVDYSINKNPQLFQFIIDNLKKLR